MELATKKPRLGYRQLTRLLRRQPGPRINYKRVQRLYQLEGLQVRRRRRKHRAKVPRMPMPVPTRPNERWSMDFRAGHVRGRSRVPRPNDRGRLYARSSSDRGGLSLPGARVVAVLDRLARTHGLPNAIVCDNGPEFAGEALDEWAYMHNVTLDFIDPRKPTQNAFIESFNGTFREECLNENWFVSLTDAQQTIEAWRVEYNTERPHSKLRDCTPREFALNLTSTATSLFTPLD